MVVYKWHILRGCFFSPPEVPLYWDLTHLDFNLSGLISSVIQQFLPRFSSDDIYWDKMFIVCRAIIFTDVKTKRYLKKLTNTAEH